MTDETPRTASFGFQNVEPAEKARLVRGIERALSNFSRRGG